jgi:hypothetical protein
MNRAFGGTRFIFAHAIALAACSAAENPTADASPTHVVVTAGDGRVTITNTWHTDIVYAARDARVQFIQPQCWAPHVCPRLAPGETAGIPFDEIVGYDETSKKLVITILEYIVDQEKEPRLGDGLELHVKL